MPNLQQPYPNEFAYLKDQRAHALDDIKSTLVSLGTAMKDGADPARWANAYPWATAGTAFGVGLTAGYVVTPRKSRRGVDAAQRAASVSPAVATGTAAETAVPVEETIDSFNPFRDKLAAGAKSMVLGAAYGLGRLALNQVLEGLLAGMHPPEGPTDPDTEYAAAHHAESFSWQPETPA